MGLVKVDLRKAERPFERVSFSDKDCVKALIKHRSIIDEYYGVDYHSFNGTEADKVAIVKPLNQEIIVLYADLDNLIARANLNIKQRFVIDRLMEGYVESEIADMFKQHVSGIYDMLDTVCRKIKKTNDFDWKYNYIYVSVLKVKWSYKKCSKCGEHKPALNEFFSPETRNKDGFRSACRACK